MSKHLCPVCGRHEFSGYDSYEICPVCDWQDDSFQEEFPDEGGCANNNSLNEARAAWSARRVA